ncbi:MAG: alanine--tRNA ligase [Nitrospirae bacterium]|nr:alanine--tRNA ligase [Nitrospirota bacterium]
MISSEIREAFLEYFITKNHTLVLSSPLIPWNDPTLLFVNAGMNQFKKIFLGEEKATYTRAVSCQKCMRAGGKHSDLENVGHTARHHTFFEMLGNFSFGDYFKKEAILFSWELFIEWFKLPMEKLYVSIYERDDEAAQLWSELTGLPDKKIVRLAAKDNFWQMGDTGPCGPCSEIIIDQGEEIGCRKPECSPGCDCDRFLELWNLVFMQYNRDVHGNLSPLPKPSIDTGMGLERISAIMQGKSTNYDTDLFQPIIKDISSLSNISYGNSIVTDTSLRVIADHIRAIVFILSEGLTPSNEGRGYVLRRIIRRASRHARLLGMHEPCLYKLTESVIDVMGKIYPEIIKEQNRTNKLLKIEEDNFNRTIETAMLLFDDLVAEVKKSGLQLIPGEEVARIHYTHGLPLDFAKDIAMDAGLIIDENALHKEMELHREKSKIRLATKELPAITVDLHMIDGKTLFVGYDTLETEAIVKAILKDGTVVDELKAGEEGNIILDITPFYGESGGQIGDKGIIETDNSMLEVLDTKKTTTDIHVHFVKVLKGKINKGNRVTCKVDEGSRKSIMRNHTATHLLHKALRIILGEHVKQSGSVVSPDRLRFDFTHFTAVHPDEIRKIEDLVNEKIIDNLPIITDIMKIDDAMKSGAVALFDEKYGETVRVVSAGDFSKELCGGTHCRATGEIGIFVIISEGSVASGIRRIEAITGKHAFEYLRQQKTTLENIKVFLKTEKPIEKIEKLLLDTKALEKEIQKLKTGSSKDIINDALKNAYDLNGVKIVKIRQDGLNHEELRLLADNVRNRLKSGIIVVLSVTDSQASIVCMVTKDLIDRYNAGDIMKRISLFTGGKGGGKSDLAQGGTKDIERLNVALENLHEIIMQ